jgi:hypothetical protein
MDGPGRSLAPLNRILFPLHPEDICVGCSKAIEAESELIYRDYREGY